MRETVEMTLLILRERQITYLIIDALDECERSVRSDLIEALERMLSETPNLLKIFASSRDDQDIVVTMNHYPNVQIHAVDNQDDIEYFVNHEVDRLVERKRLLPTQKMPPHLCEKIKKTLREGARGM